MKKLLIDILLSPVGFIVIGIIACVTLGKSMYEQEDSFLWIIAGVIITVIGIIRLVVFFMGNSSDNTEKTSVNEPVDLNGYNNRGKFYLEKRNYDLAITDFTKVIDMDVNYVPAYVSRGFAYESNGKIDLAKADYRKALSIDPNYTLAKDYLEKLN